MPSTRKNAVGSVSSEKPKMNGETIRKAASTKSSVTWTEIEMVGIRPVGNALVAATTRITIPTATERPVAAPES